MIQVWSSGFITGLGLIMILQKKWMRAVVYAGLAIIQLAFGLAHP